MNKKVMKAAFVAAIAMVSGINVFNVQKSEVLSDIALANVEALAEGEGSKECRWMRVQDDYGCVFHVCVAGGTGDICTCGDQRG
jgi:hypothetical protein